MPFACLSLVGTSMNIIPPPWTMVIVVVTCRVPFLCILHDQKPYYIVVLIVPK